MDWLQELERRVKEASRALADLRRENAKLKAKVRRLESAAASAAPDPGWRRQRDEARQRLERLGRRLQTLVDD